MGVVCMTHRTHLAILYVNLILFDETKRAKSFAIVFFYTKLEIILSCFTYFFFEYGKFLV